jgi:hypothetical protein
VEGLELIDIGSIPSCGRVHSCGERGAPDLWSDAWTRGASFGAIRPLVSTGPGSAAGGSRLLSARALLVAAGAAVLVAALVMAYLPLLARVVKAGPSPEPAVEGASLAQARAAAPTPATTVSRAPAPVSASVAQPPASPAPTTSATPSTASAAPAVTPITTAPASAAAPPGYGCGAALLYLAAHANPLYALECPGYADGNQAMTCTSHLPECGSGQYVIAIADPCPAAYMNEAVNSWSGGRQVDPYGYCGEPDNPLG